MARLLKHVVTVVLKQAKDGPLVKALYQGGSHEIMDVLTLSQPSRGVPSATRKMMTLWSPFLLVIRACWEHARSFPTSSRWVVLPLIIRLLLPRKVLMISGAVRCAWLPLRRVLPFLLLLLLLPLSLSRKISSLISRKESREMLPCSIYWRIPDMGLMAPVYPGTGTSTRCLWCAQLVFQADNWGIKTYSKPSKSTCMLSSRECCRWTKGKPWWDHMRQQLMPNRSLKSCVKTPSDLPIPPLILQDSCCTSLLWGLGMVIGMELPIASSSTGRSRFDCMSHLLTRQPTSVLSRRCTCCRMQSTPCKNK